MASFKNTRVNDTGFLEIPAGTIAQRPASPVKGMYRYNSELDEHEYYDGSSWVLQRKIIAAWDLQGLQPDHHYNLSDPNCWTPPGSLTLSDLSGTTDAEFERISGTANPDFLGIGRRDDPYYASLSSGLDYFLCKTSLSQSSAYSFAIEFISDDVPSIVGIVRHNSNKGWSLGVTKCTLFGIAEYPLSISSTPSGVNHWFLFVDGTVYRVYRNGVQVGSTSISGSRTDAPSSPGIHSFAALNTDGSIAAEYNGTMYYWAFYKFASTLTAEDIRIKYENAKTIMGVIN